MVSSSEGKEEDSSTMEDLDDEGIRDPASPRSVLDSPSFKLSIISYGHAKGPLRPLPHSASEEQSSQMTFSVRDIPNPPAKLRKTDTGLSSRLRKEIFSNRLSREKLDMIVQAVEARMKEIEREKSESELSLGFSTLIVGIDV